MSEAAFLQNTPDDDGHEHAPTAAPPSFLPIDTEAKAEWVVELLLANEFAIERREAALKALKALHERNLDFFLPHLEAYYESNPPRRGRTIKLANGSIGMREVPGGLRIDNEVACIEWARKHLPDALVPSFVENLDKARVRAELERVYSAAYTAGFEAAPAGLSSDEAALYARARAEEAVKAAGATMKPDEDRIYIKAPRAPKES